MVRVAEKAKASGLGQPVFGALLVSRSGIRNLQASCMPRRRSFGRACADHDLVVVIGAPVFTFHVEGHAAIFDGATTIFQITDDADAAAVPPTGTSIVATMKPALDHAARAVARDHARACRQAAFCRRRRAAADPIPVEYPAAFAFAPRCPRTPCWSRKRRRTGRRCRNSCRCAARTAFTPWRAAASAIACRPSVGMALGRPERRTVCLIGDGSAMYSIQALWTAAQRKLPLTVVVINNAGYGAMRSFSQVMQVRNVPGLDLPGIDFVKIAEGMGCDAVRVDKIIRARAGADARRLRINGVEPDRGDGGFGGAAALRAEEPPDG